MPWFLRRTIERVPLPASGRGPPSSSSDALPERPARITPASRYDLFPATTGPLDSLRTSFVLVTIDLDPLNTIAGAEGFRVRLDRLERRLEESAINHDPFVWSSDFVGLTHIEGLGTWNRLDGPRGRDPRLRSQRLLCDIGFLVGSLKPDVLLLGTDDDRVIRASVQLTRSHQLPLSVHYLAITGLYPSGEDPWRITLGQDVLSPLTPRRSNP